MKKKVWDHALGLLFPSANKILLKMKLTLCIILFSFLGAMATDLYSQTTKLTLDLKNASVKEVLGNIENQSEFFFLYSEKIIDVTREVNIDVRESSIEKILDRIFAGTNVSYTVKGRQIVLTTPESNQSGTPSSTMQQQKNISGKVSDSSGGPLPGVSVVIKGTTNGTITDMDGKYNLPKVSETSILVFSFVGMKSQEITVGNKTLLNVVLAEESIGLEEVVAVGYGVQKKSNISGAIASVKSADFENRSSENIGKAIQGKMGGVQVINNSGAPGSSTAFRIRGYSSTSGSSDPLYLVDGLKVTNIDYLDPENIASIEILKDAASAAIYGAEAGNGVVLVTTKNGKEKTGSSIFYNSSFSWSSETNKIQMMNASQFKEYWLESGYVTSDVSFGKANTDWQKVMFETGFQQRHTIGGQGSNDKGSYFVSLNFLTNNGIIVGNSDVNKHLTAQINGDYKIRPWLKLGSTTSIERGKTKAVSENNFTGTGSVVGGAYYYDPTVPVFYQNDQDAPASLGLLNAEANGYKVFRTNGKLLGGSQIMVSNLWNPIGMIDFVDNSTWRTNVNGTVYADLTPLKGLTITSRLGYRLGNQFFSNYTSPYYFNPIQTAKNPLLSSGNTNTIYYQWENFANYLKKIGKHDITLMAGTSFINNRSESVSATTDGLANNAENFRYLDFFNSSATTRRMTGQYGNVVNMSYFGRLGYSFDDRYLIQFNFRADAFDTSKLPLKNSWGYFPSFSGGWVVSKEPFFRALEQKALTFLKLRASWGINGNINILSGYPYTNSVSVQGSIYDINNTGLNSAAEPATYTTIWYGNYPWTIKTVSLANPNLTWEESKQSDVGLEARLFKDRLTIDVDYFKKITTNQLATITAPAISGASSMTVNGGKILNSGTEFNIGWKDKIRGFSYSINANLSTLHNEVLESPYGKTGRQGALTGGLTGNVNYLEAGYPMWYLRAYVPDHIDQATGMPVYKTAQQLGTDDGKAYVGSGIPDFTYGLTLNLAYKGIDLSVFGSGVQGNKQFLGIYKPVGPITNLPAFLYNDRWTPTNTTAKYPKANSTDPFFATSSYWVFNASYFRIKQIQLGYTLPAKLLEKTKLSSLRIYGSVENALTITKYPGSDPESMSGTAGSFIGYDHVNFPQTKVFILGLNVAF
jgi:TonB-linked SusC/RagA family outer membrane protein